MRQQLSLGSRVCRQGERIRTPAHEQPAEKRAGDDLSGACLQGTHLSHEERVVQDAVLLVTGLEAQADDPDDAPAPRMPLYLYCRLP